jgi:hypothetical protein
MQIGEAELDRVCAEAIVPAVEATGLEARRVDKHNQGGLLKSEIIEFIQRAEVIVADLTNERPNCYLEVGYAMGIDKFRNLILTAREDHLPDSPNYVRGGPKIHFDLIGYDILLWHPDRLPEFRLELEKRIRRRRAVLAPPASAPPSVWDDEWIESHRKAAQPGLKATEKRGFMEVRFALDHPKPSKTQVELDEAARAAEIRTFGWPIGVYLSNRDDYRPRPTADGIVAVIAAREVGTYDYWTIRRNGDFYLLKAIFEDERGTNKLFFDTRIVRITESLLYCARLYGRLKVDVNHTVHIAVRHGGLRGRILGASNPNRYMRKGLPAEEDEIEGEVQSSLNGVQTNLTGLVKQITAPLFVLFDFFQLADGIYEEIVDAFVEGRVI